MGKLNAVKVTLSTKKVVLLRELKISDTEIAAQEVASRANGDSTLLQIFMQKVLLKNTLISVDGKALTAVEKQDMDSLFSMVEYTQLLGVVQKLAGGDDAGKSPQLEVVNTGDNSPGSVDTQA